MRQRKSATLPRYTTPQPVRGWRWFTGTVVILAFWLIGGSLLGLVFLPYTGVNPSALVEGDDILGAMPGWGYLFFALVTFIPLFLGVLVAYRWILGVKLRYLFSRVNDFRWWRVALGFWVWLILIGGPVVISLAMTPELYRFNYQPETFIPFAVIGLLLLPIQTTAEELFFRGWVLQWAGKRIGNIVALSVISGVAFSIPHLLNPRWAAMSSELSWGISRWDSLSRGSRFGIGPWKLLSERTFPTTFLQRSLSVMKGELYLLTHCLSPDPLNGEPVT